MHKKLFIPGPTEVREDVREAMNFPMFGHRMPETTQLMGEVADKWAAYGRCGLLGREYSGLDKHHRHSGSYPSLARPGRPILP